MVVVDSSVWIDFFADRPTVQVRKLLSVRPARSIIVGDIVLLEILRGARDDAHAAALDRRLRAFQLRPFLDADLARKAAASYRALRSKGFTVRRAVDLVIGAYCIEHAFPLLHNDRDFTVMREHLGLIEY